jgi:hypothetical protein
MQTVAKPVAAGQHDLDIKAHKVVAVALVAVYKCLYTSPSLFNKLLKSKL